MTRTLFISDLHLSDKVPQINEKFFYFLKNILKKSDTLYILGDFFEYWIGEDCITHYQKNILETLKQLPNTIYFLPGNRDFLIEPTLLAQHNIHYLPDPSIISIGSENFLLGHGDKWCTENIAYQAFRIIVRNPLVQFIFRSLPKKIRLSLAKNLRKKSQHSPNFSENINLEDINLEAALKKISNNEINYIINGHTHNPILELIFDTTALKLKRITLSDWNNQQGGNAYIVTDIAKHYFQFF